MTDSETRRVLKRPCKTGLRAVALIASMVSFWLTSQGTVEAQAPEIQVVTSAEEIFIGDSIDYQVEIRNVQNPPAPDLSAIKERFEVAATGDQSRDQSSITIINGKVTKSNVLSHIYQYRLTPKTSGEMTIPPTQVTIEGKTLTSSEVPLKVIEAEEQDLVVAEIKTTQTRVYPTQSFDVMLRVLVQPLPDNSKTDPLVPLQRRPPHLQVNWVDPPAGLAAADKASWLQPLVSDDGVGFTLNDVSTRSGSFFDGPRAAVFNLRKDREIREGLDGKKIKYFVYELSRTLTAERTGVYSLGPGLVKGTFVTGLQRKEYIPRRLVASASAVNVEVREVPTPRPVTFCGGIGEYQVFASASPTKLRVGDPLTLTVELERGHQSGSLELISAPDLTAIPELDADFDLIDKSPTGRIDGSRKKFVYAMRPKRSSAGIPPIVVSAFNTQTEEFENIQTAAIPLDITEAERLNSGELIGTRPTIGSSSIKSRAEGIFQNITDPSQVRDQRISLIAWSKAALGVWSAAGCLVGLVTLLRRRSSDTGRVRRQQARSTANRKLSEARSLAKKGEQTESLRQVRSAIVGLVADLQNRVAEGLTAADVNSTLTAASINDDERLAVVKLLESIESAEYGAGESTDPIGAIEEAAGLISRIAPRLERGLRAGTLVMGCLLLNSLISGEAHAAQPGSHERSFVRSLELFDSAKSQDEYRESAQLLEGIVADGFRNGAVYYNLGNAYYRAGEYGRAILNYRKAMPYLPNYPYLAANLEQALAAAPGRLAEPPRPWWSHVLFWTDWLSFPAKVKVFFYGLTVGAIVTAASAMFRVPRLSLPIAILVFCSLAVGLDAALSDAEITGFHRAVITGETMARKGTGNLYETAFDQPLRDGAEFQILNETHDWTFGHFEGIGDGWVRNEFVAR
jgi:tetratricopeptide (TPR) repeat protein